MTANFTFEKLERDTLNEQVHRELRAAIMAARFAPGERLTVRAISAAFGVSTMPVRAAFARLAAEKAVMPLANGTISIPRLTRQRFDELAELRVLLEGTATEKAAALMTDVELAELDRLDDVLKAAAAAGDADTYLQHNQVFKFTIYNAARGPVLADLIERIWLQIGPLLRLYTSDFASEMPARGRNEIIAALRRRDAAAARLATERDIRSGTGFLLRVAWFPDQPANGSDEGDG